MVATLRSTVQVASLALVLSTAGTAAVAQTATPAAGGAVTFAKDVAPILQRSCQNCHRPESIAPMSLLTYKDARPWARSIRQKVSTREMPPWHVDRNVGITKFIDDPSLTQEEIATIVKWVDGGAVEGNPSDMPAPRVFEAADVWHIGKPDIIIRMPEAYVVPPHGPDEFVDFEVDPGFKEDVYIQAVETRPEAQGFRVVHHALSSMIEDPDDPSGYFFNEYALGKGGDVFPADSGRLIKAGSKVSFSLHLHPNGEAVPVQIAMGLKVYPKGVVPKHVALTQHMGDFNELDFPAGEVTRTEGYFRLAQPAVILSFQPHMHRLGKAQCMEAVYPDLRADTARAGVAKSETLSCVNYQFGWSLTYTYAEDSAPLLPAGTVVHVMSWHDNSAANKFNPNPKNWKGYGQRTVEEMSFSWINLYYLSEAEYQQRVKDRAARSSTQDQQQ